MDLIYLKVVNGNLKALNDFIMQDRQMTYLSADVASGGAALTVFSTTGFSIGNYYCLINPNHGNAELIKMHASTALTSTVITLAANLANAHNANEPVYFVNFNQVEFSRATTATGSKTTLATQAIDPTRKFTLYSDITNSTGYAFVRFKNEAGATYSSYSAASPYTESSFNTAEYMIEEAMREAKGEFSETLTPNYLLSQINEALREVRKYKNKLSWAQSFNAVLGQTAQGVFRYSLPSDIYDKYSPKAIEAVRLGGEPNLVYVDPNYFFNILMDGVHFTQVRTAVTGAAGTTTLEVDNSYDFESSGSLYVGDNTLTYTGVTRSSTAGVFTGIPASSTGSMVDDIAVDDFVFQDEDTGEPARWTMYNGYLYIWELPDSTWDNYNINIDYYKTVTEVDSLDDAVDYIQFDMIKNWLIWKIRTHMKNDGVADLKDPAYQLFREQLAVMVRKDRPLNKTYFRNVYEFSDEDDDINPRQRRDGQV